MPDISALCLQVCKDSSTAAECPGGRRKGNCDVRIDICSLHADDDDVVVAVAPVRTSDLVFAPVETCVSSSHAHLWEQE